MRFDENLFTCQCENEDKMAEGYQISHSCWSFSSDVTAVKRLNHFLLPILSLVLNTPLTLTPTPLHPNPTPRRLLISIAYCNQTTQPKSSQSVLVNVGHLKVG